MCKLDLYKGDCLEIIDTLIDRGVKVDMILCDPPYGTTQCKWDNVIPFEEMWDRLNKITNTGTPILLFGREPFTSELIHSNVKKYKHKWIWNKKQSGSPQNAKYMPLQLDEDIIVFSNDGKKVNYFPVMRKGKMRKRGGYKKSNAIMGEFKEKYSSYSDEYFPTNIIEIANPRTGKFHPTQKPVELLEYLIKTYTNEGDVVLDFTMGSGSTGVACMNTNRKFIGIELDGTYFEIAEKRIKDVSKN